VDREELAYVAGVFDGEGHISAFTRRTSIGRVGVRLVLAITQKHRFMLDRVQLSVGGTVYSNDRLGYPIYTLRMHRFEIVQNAIARMWPWLGPVKRAEADEALGFYVHWKVG